MSEKKLGTVEMKFAQLVWEHAPISSTALVRLCAKELGWKAERGIEKMCEDLWRWQSKNPYGYKGQ